MKELKDILTMKHIEIDVTKIVSDFIIAAGFVIMVLALQYMTTIS